MESIKAIFRKAGTGVRHVCMAGLPGMNPRVIPGVCTQGREE